MKAGNRVQVINELEPIDGFSFVGMTGTVKKSFPDGVIIDLDDTLLDGIGRDLFFEYAELEKI